MATEKVGLSESTAMAIGGMVGGGIFAALGVVAAAAGPLAWFAFVVAGIIAASAGYSFIRLNGLIEETTGPIGYVQQFTGNSTLAGMVGWTFVFGYIGTMSMYAYAFGGYFAELVGVHTLYGLPLRPVVSVLTVAVFVGLNVAGAHASGRTEDVLVGLKVIILLLFGLGGLYYGFSRGRISLGLSRLGVGPLIAAAISFVAFEGWELLFFDQDSIENPKATVKRAVYVSIAAATTLYVLVAIVTTNLTSAQVIQQHSETALAIAAKPFLGAIGFMLISIAALFSTGSAINATLFSSARLSKQLAAKNMLPTEIESSGDEPIRSLLLLGALTALFTFFGSLDGITSFASLAFITIFGGISYLAFRERENIQSAVIPAVGALGATATVAALLWHLFTAEIGVFWTVVAISVFVVVVELLYFERDHIERDIERVEDRI